MKMPELQNILEQYGKQYKEEHDLPIYVKKTLNAIYLIHFLLNL